MQNRKCALNEHQQCLLLMLQDLDAVCAKYGISYQLFAGTALGAVRHQGFIPWDDDLDIIMQREEYERFFRVAPLELDPQKYYVQEEYGPHWPMQFSKLRLNGTTCIERCHVRDPEMHQGVYIDIFPCDNLADNPFIRKLQFAVSKVVIAKSLYARGYETPSCAKKIFLQLCRLLPKKPLWRFCIRRKDNGSQMVHSFFGCGTKYEKNIFPRVWMEESQNVLFEGQEFPISAHWEELLTKLYGDYRTLPPESERDCKVHAAILDLYHSYETHLAEQQAMKIETYTRSIR